MSSTKIPRFNFLRGSNIKRLNYRVEGLASYVNDKNMLASAVEENGLSEIYHSLWKDATTLASTQAGERLGQANK